MAFSLLNLATLTSQNWKPLTLKKALKLTKVKQEKREALGEGTLNGHNKDGGMNAYTINQF